MSDEITVPAKTTLAGYVRGDAVQLAIKKSLGKRATQFTASILSLANATPKLKECDPEQLVSVCMQAATLDLPINANLGFAYIIPYKTNGRQTPQFQMGYKGFIQLALRSGQFRTINVTEVREGELESFDRLTGEMKFCWHTIEREERPVIGYVAYFELINGFRKALYMTAEELQNHAKQYSQSYKSGYGKWADDFDSMAKKTVIKLLLSRWAPLSVEMQKAIELDQSDGEKYPDNKPQFDVIPDDEVEEAELEEPIQ